LPAHVLGATVIQVAGENEEKIREAIHVFEDGRVDRFLRRSLRYITLRPPGDGSRVVQVSGGGAASRKHEAIERRQGGVEPVNRLFEPFDLLVADAKF
jgi:hypothetical protein